MKVNTGKSHLLASGNVRSKAKIDNNYIESEKEQVLLGITIDSNATFENHINNICKNASQKLNTVARVAPYMNRQKRRILKYFVTSQFGYCPSIWMFHTRRLNNKINTILERALRMTYQDHISTFQELLNKDDSVSIHHRNLQFLATDMSLSLPLELKQLESLEVFKLKIKKWIPFGCPCRLCRTYIQVGFV